MASPSFARRTAGNMATASSIAVLGDGVCQLMEGVDPTTLSALHEETAWKTDRKALAEDYDAGRSARMATYRVLQAPIIDVSWWVGDVFRGESKTADSTIPQAPI